MLGFRTELAGKEGIRMGEEKTKSFLEVVNTLRYRNLTWTVACKGTQRELLEKQIGMCARFGFVDKRTFATTYYIANGSRVVIMHEKLLTPQLKTKVDLDVRKWEEEEIKKFFVDKEMRRR